MIVKENGLYYVYSENKSKKLSKGYKSKKEADKRLREIEYFKHMNKTELTLKSVNPYTKIEMEHKDLFDAIRADVKKHGKVTMTDYQMADMIRARHEKESSDYYKKLLKYVE